MLHFITNLPIMYQEYAFLDRFAAAAKDGSGGVESLLLCDLNKADIRARLDNTDPTQMLFNVPPGGWTGGERGVVSLPGREEESKRGIVTALEYAQMLGDACPYVMVGLLPIRADRAYCRAIYMSNIAYAAREAIGAGATIVLGLINTRDIPGFFFVYQAQAHVVCKEVGTASVKVRLDLCRAQTMEGGLLVRLRQYIDDVGHVQIAGMPGHHEPDKGEPHYPHLFALLDVFGCNGWVGCEYRPRAGTSEGPGWLRRWRENQR